MPVVRSGVRRYSIMGNRRLAADRTIFIRCKFPRRATPFRLSLQCLAHHTQKTLLILTGQRGLALLKRLHPQQRDASAKAPFIREKSATMRPSFKTGKRGPEKLNHLGEMSSTFVCLKLCLQAGEQVNNDLSSNMSQICSTQVHTDPAATRCTHLDCLSNTQHQHLINKSHPRDSQDDSGPLDFISDWMSFRSFLPPGTAEPKSQKI
ncbi:hypothetical protein VTN31DRAFT_1457 [Thermomyces dupontii]|uniref:uncharacterized protein n=1 Tax=Talaromyces thermophilus TaxID=28565 RepID=UPI003742B545